MTPKIIGQGAEAIISKNHDTITKTRIKKSYRITFLDDKLRKTRTKSESKILKKLHKIIPVPTLIKTDDKQEIIMEYIIGKKLSNELENLDYKKIAKLIGENISKMHDSGIIHNDLTTSNMIFNKNKVYFIDFGLSYHSNKIEDKAVDLHLLAQALEAKHFTIYQEILKIILDNYKPEKSSEIKERIKKIESRGRYKDKY